MSGARLPDWDNRFTAYLREARAAVRAGGQDYCALFAAGSVEAITGDNPTKPFRGRYREVADNLETIIAGLFPETTPGLAQRGDLAWHDGSVGVVIGGEALFVSDDNCFARVPRHEWERAWSVG